MKILFVTDLYPINDDKTIPNIVEDFALAFKQKGNIVEVLRGNFLFNSLIRKHKIFKNGEYYRNGIKIYNENHYLPFLNSNFSNNNYDLIISHMPSGHILASKISKKLNIPYIAIVHQSDYTVKTNYKYAFYFKKALKEALEKAKLIGARNMFLTQNFNADFILPSFIEKEKIVDNKAINNEKLKLITLSKFIKRKNIDLVIKALAKLEGDFEYSIYGEGPEKRNLEKLIKKFNLQDKIKIYPHINHKFVWEKLDENDIFILPSVRETFGVSYLEAMARGLIVVGVKNTGVDGIITNKEDGFLINPDEEEILNVLKELKIMDRERMIEKSLQNAKKYTQEEIMNKYDEIIKKIL